MRKKIVTIVSGAPSGALAIAMIVAEHLKSYAESTVVLRKYNKSGLANVKVIGDLLVVDYIWGLYYFLKQYRPDVIWVHGYSTHLWTKIAAAFLKIPVVHIEHNTEKYTPFRRWLLKKLDAYTERYICVSHGVATHLKKQGVPAEKVEVIYNGIELDQFSCEKQEQPIFTVGMTARFSKQKDQLTLIKAIEILVRREKIPIKLILQGDGKQRLECKDYVAKRALETVVFFETGRFMELAPRLDVFVLATHYEGLPLVICEAMAAKIPVIASNVPGVDELIIENKDGFLVEPNHPEGLASQIHKLVLMREKQPEQMRVVIENAHRKVINEFSLTKMCNQYSRLFK